MQNNKKYLALCGVADHSRPWRARGSTEPYNFAPCHYVQATAEGLTATDGRLAAHLPGGYAKPGYYLNRALIPVANADQTYKAELKFPDIQKVVPYHTGCFSLNAEPPTKVLSIRLSELRDMANTAIDQHRQYFYKPDMPIPICAVAGVPLDAHYVLSIVKVFIATGLALTDSVFVRVFDVENRKPVLFTGIDLDDSKPYHLYGKAAFAVVMPVKLS